MATKTTDREVDPALAATHELYGLLLAARREPGVRVCRAFPIDLKDRLVERAEHEGFGVMAIHHGTAPSELVTLAVWWKEEIES